MEREAKKMAHSVIAAGGTFDHLHAGHKAFLLWLFDQAERVLLGITSDTFAQQTKNAEIASFLLRKKHVEDFLKDNGLRERVTIVSIDDVYGPLLTNDVAVDVVGVTGDTRSGAEKINEKRQEIGLPALLILTMPLITTGGQPISSTAIRSGEINTNGHFWVKDKWKEKTYILPKSLRSKLHEPFGPILSSIPQDIDPERVITVGDVTTKLFNIHHIGQKISLFDLVVERTRLFSNREELEFGSIYTNVVLTNPAGHITKEAWGVIEKAIAREKPTSIQVEGEEDLLVLVCILVSPLGYSIFYGQPHAGLVQVDITLEVKKQAFELMDAFTPIEF